MRWFLEKIRLLLDYDAAPGSFASDVLGSVLWVS